MKNAIGVIICVVSCLIVASAFAVTTFEEQTLKNGHILVTQSEKTVERVFVTEPVPYMLTLDREQKEKLWQGASLLVERKEIFFTSILQQPSAKGMTNAMTVTWSDGKYNINSNKRYYKLSPSPLIIMLYIITLGILIIDILAVYRSTNGYKEAFVYNVIMLIVNPLIVIIGAICWHWNVYNVVVDIFGVIAMICYILALFFFPVLAIFDWIIATSKNSIWLKLFASIVSISAGICIVMISTFTFWDTIIMDNVGFGVAIEWILYLASCLVCLPLSIILIKSVIESLRTIRS